MDDETALLSAFANPKMAESINAAIDEGLQTPGAEEVTARYRKGPRLVTLNGAVYLRPTIVRCDSLAHPLAGREYFSRTPVSSECLSLRSLNRSDRRWS